MDTDRIWVEAQPKETELTDVRPGEPATITVDTYPGREWHGTVASLSPAAQSEFSLLPAQNTSGNWVKVVQRIPLRVQIDATDKSMPPLRAGMSVEVSVYTGHKRGLPHFLTALFGGGDARLMAATGKPGATAAAPNRLAITACVVLATVMQALDTTIANVSLPYIQGSVAANQDEIEWVLTSYIVAAAIMTQPTGFLAARFGVKRAVPDLDRRVHDRVDAVRHGPLAGRNRAFPADPGRLWSGIGAALASGADEHLSEGASGPGHGVLGHGHHDRPDHRPGSRRLAHL